jgi:hypothetical protein
MTALLAFLCALLCAFGLAGAARADWPERPVKLICRSRRAAPPT